MTQLPSKDYYLLFSCDWLQMSPEFMPGKLTSIPRRRLACLTEPRAALAKCPSPCEPPLAKTGF